MDNNSKLTEEYKSEITDILAKISLGLGISVTDVINPRIEIISSNVEQNKKTIEIIKANNEQYINKVETIAFSLKEQITILNDYYNNINNSVDSIISEIKNIERTISIKTDERFTLLEGLINSNGDDIKDEAKILGKVIAEGYTNLKGSSKLFEEKIAGELKIFSDKIIKLESDNKIEVLLNEVELRQKKTVNIIYVLFFIILVSFIMSISLFLK